jgi:hydrogenase expression/formation protein HypC
MMCLAVPAKLVTRFENTGLADLHGNRIEVCTLLVPDAIPGDWLLIHAGFAIQRLSADEAQKTFEVLHDVQRAQRGGP